MYMVTPSAGKLARNSFIEQAVVVGFGLDQPIALVCLSENTKSMSKDEIVHDLTQTLEAVNSECESYSKLSHIVVFREVWAEDSGLFTPTLKIKRHMVDGRFKEHYQKWSSSKIRIAWA